MHIVMHLPMLATWLRADFFDFFFEIYGRVRKVKIFKKVAVAPGKSLEKLT